MPATSYGTTYKYDGDNDGVVYELQKKPAWKDRVLYTFTNNSGGENPYAGLVMTAKGTLYGTAIESGPDDGGVAYELVRGKGHAVDGDRVARVRRDRRRQRAVRRTHCR